MTQKKPIINDGIIIHKDYEYLFNMLSDDELGKTIRLLLCNTLNPTLNPTNDTKINNVFNYIANRIIDYNSKKYFFSKSGKSGGNPKLLSVSTLKGRDKGGDKLREENISKDNIREEVREEVRSSPAQKFLDNYLDGKNSEKIDITENFTYDDELKEWMEKNKISKDVWSKAKKWIRVNRLNRKITRKEIKNLILKQDSFEPGEKNE